jgi:hypothetical protein
MELLPHSDQGRFGQQLSGHQLSGPTRQHNAASRQYFHSIKHYPAGQILPSGKKIAVKSIFTLRGQGVASRLFSPASPTASPESE